MKINIEDKNKAIIAEEGKWLYDGQDFIKSIYVALNLEIESQWTEVTDEYKQQREAEMLAEMESEEYMESEEVE